MGYSIRLWIAESRLQEKFNRSKEIENMPQELLKLIEMARQVQMTLEEKEEQRISFAYGNVRFENQNMTLEAVVRASASLKEQTDEQSKQSESRQS